jgi:hypothetical protein
LGNISAVFENSGDLCFFYLFLYPLEGCSLLILLNDPMFESSDKTKSKFSYWNFPFFKMAAESKMAGFFILHPTNFHSILTCNALRKRLVIDFP